MMRFNKRELRIMYRNRKYLLMLCLLALFLVTPLIGVTDQNTVKGETPDISVGDLSTDPLTVSKLGEGDEGDQGESETIERQELQIRIKNINNGIDTLTTVAEFDAYNKSEIKWVLIENNYGYYGFAMSGAWGHGEVIIAPKSPSYTLNEPLYGIFLEVHFKFNEVWYNRYLTSDEWGVDFRQNLVLEETLWGVEHREWDLSYSASISAGAHSLAFSVGIKVSTSDIDAKVYSTIEPLTQNYQDFGFTYVLVENPDPSLEEQWRINYLRFNNGSHEKIISADQDKDIRADEPNHLLFVEALNTNDPASPFYLYRWDFNDLRESGLTDLTFNIDDNTTLPNDKFKPTLQVGGYYRRAVLQNEEIFIDPMINTDPEPATYLFKGDWATAGSNWVLDSNSVGGSAQDGYYNDAENDIIDNDGWNYAEDQATFHHGLATPYEGSQSQQIHTLADGGSQGTVNTWKSFAVTDDDNVWLCVAAKTTTSEYSSEIFIKIVIGSDQYYLWLDDDTAPPVDDGDNVYLNQPNVDGTWFYWTGNITEIFETEFSITSFSALQIEARIEDNSGSGGSALDFDAIAIHGQDDGVNFAEFYYDHDNTVYYDRAGLHCSDTADETFSEQHQILPITGLDLDASPKQYYVEYELTEPLEGTGAVNDIDDLRIYFRDGAVGDVRRIHICRSTTSVNETNGDAEDIIFIEVGTSLSGFIDVTAIFDGAGWLDDGMNRVAYINMYIAVADTDDFINIEKYMLYEGSAGAGPTITNVVEPAVGTDPLTVSADITDISGVDTTLISYWHSTDNGTLDAFSLLTGSNFTMVNSVGDTYTNNSCTLAGCSNEPYIRYTIYANDTFNNWATSTGYFQFDQGVSLSSLSISDNERLGFSEQEFSITAEQITTGVGIEIDSVKFRYTYESQLNQYEIYSEWITMSLSTGDNESGSWVGSFNINTTYFDEDDSYSLQIKGENTNSLTATETINFIADSTPQSGLTLGRLNQAVDIVECGNFTEDIPFSATITFAESHYVYTNTLSGSQWEDKLVDFELITGYFCYAENLLEMEIYKSGSRYYMKLRFSEKPEEDSTATVKIWESEPFISNPAVNIVGSENIVYSLDVSTARDYDEVKIGDMAFPSGIVAQAWWSNYEINDYDSWSTFTDENLNEPLDSNVTVWADSLDKYKAHIEIENLDLTVEITKIYIKGELKEVTVGFRLNMVGILLGLVLPFGAYTILTVVDYTPVDLSAKIKKMALLATVGLGAVVGVVFQFVSTPFAIMPLGTMLSGIPSVALPTALFVLVMPTVVVLLLLMIAQISGNPFDRKQTLNLLLVDLTIEVLLSIAYIQGVLSLSIAGLETANQMIINVAFSGMIAVSIIIATALILKVKAGELSVG